MSKEHYEKGVIKQLFTEEQIKTRVKELGEKITNDYKDRDQDLIVVCLLKGSISFFADLCREIKLPMKMDFMTVSSYGDDTKTSRDVKIVKDLDEIIIGKDILVIEDIIDSGLTLKKILKILGNREPKSISLCTLLNKECNREADVDVQYVGFPVGDEFVIGYGLDYRQEYRNLPYIGILDHLSNN